MSTREIAYQLIDSLSEEQLNAVTVILQSMTTKEQPRHKKASEVKGILHQYADPARIPSEEGAWERDVIERYQNGKENS